MIGVPMPNPRDSIIADLNQKLEHFFGAGKTVQEIASGVSGERAAIFGSAHSSKLRATRDKAAPQLRALAESGLTVVEAAKEMGMEAKRARLIARESNINFPGAP